MTDDRHLPESDRQGFVDGTLSQDQRQQVEAHLRDCERCAADVRALELVMSRFRSAPPSAAPVDDLWPSIRQRIEQGKVLTLNSAATPERRRFAFKRAVAFALLAASAILAAVMLRPSRRISPDAVTVVAESTSLRTVSDSVKSYAEEAQALLNRLEVQRAMMRPDAAAAIDADLKTIDDAIAELEQAIANDPRNPALRRLLASSYRQKVELLKRAGNAS